MCNLFDPKSNITEGIISCVNVNYTNDISFDNLTWGEINNNLDFIDIKLALQEFIFIMRKSMSSEFTTKLYNTVFLLLHEQDIDKNIPNNYDNTIFLKKLKISLSTDELLAVPVGSIMDASIMFALFYICKQLAEVAGHTMIKNNQENINYSITPTGSIYSSKYSTVRNTSNDYVFASVNTEQIKKRIAEGENIKQKVDGIYVSTKKNHIGLILLEVIKQFIPIRDNAEFFKFLSPIRAIISQSWEGNALLKTESYKDFLESKLIEKEHNSSLPFCILSALQQQLEIVVIALTRRFAKILIPYNEEIINRIEVKLLAVGDGSETSGLLSMWNVGILNFKYRYMNNNGEIKVCNTVTDTIKIKRGEILHFNFMGIDGNKNEFSISHENNSYQKLYFNVGLRGCEIQPFPNIILQERDNRTTDIFSKYQNRAIRLATYRKENQELRFYNDFNANIELKSEKSDEILLYLCKIKDYQISESVLYYNGFDSGCFQLSKDAICNLYRDNKEAFDNIINLLRNDFSIEQNLSGEFVGKSAQFSLYSEKDVEANHRYCFGYGEKPLFECRKCQDDKKLRMSRVVITTDYINKKICISIVSHTSPVVIDFNDLFNSSYTPPNMSRPDYDNLITRYTKYTVSSDDQRPSQNQVLAMLRSMGMFEAIYSILYVKANNDASVISKLNALKGNVSCMDRTGTVRGHEELNLVNPLLFDDYDSYKWYKNEDDYNKYLHGEYNNLNLE